MTYQPYEPGQPDPHGDRDEHDPFDTRGRDDLPGYETYPAAPTSPPAAHTRRSTGSADGTWSGPALSRSRGGRGATGNHTGAVVGGLVGVVAVVGLIGFGTADTGPSYGPGPITDTSCAAEHDETGSMFSDAEWCALELNGGDGNLDDLDDSFGDDSFGDDPFGDDPFDDPWP